jgi:SAM-dependent methyltransferase
MNQFWDDRYRNPEYAYGEAPNLFFEQQLGALRPGVLLLPAEGEGRNAVHAARLGWEVHAFDQSVEGQKKALLLAQKHGVEIAYGVGDFEEMRYPKEMYDAVGLIFAHFPIEKRRLFHENIDLALKPGGVLIIEAFSKQHLEYVTTNPKVGGPRDIDLLYSIEEIQRDFQDYEVLELIEQEVLLKEGAFHDGLGSVLRFVGRKRKTQ